MSLFVKLTSVEVATILKILYPVLSDNAITNMTHPFPVILKRLKLAESVSVCIDVTGLPSHGLLNQLNSNHDGTIKLTN